MRDRKDNMNAEQAIEIIRLLHNLEVTGYIVIALLGAIVGVIIGRAFGIFY